MKIIIICLIVLAAIIVVVVLLQLYFEKNHTTCKEDSMLPSMFRMAKVEESITIAKPIHEVFSFVTDIKNTDRISEHLIDVTPITEGSVKEGSSYKQTRTIHGNKNFQTVEVVAYKPDEIYTIKTELVGLGVTYTYRFTPVDANTTTLDLTKQACGKGFMKFVTPLLKHLFTRPEHDGQHLTVLKKAVENQ